MTLSPALYTRKKAFKKNVLKKISSDVAAITTPKKKNREKKKISKNTFQSGALPYLIHENRLYVMLVSAVGSNVWILPKGNIAKGLTPHESAAKEALEEAGIIGICSEKEIGDYCFSKLAGTMEIRVRIYPMKIDKYLSEWEESGMRSRRLLFIDDAIRIVRDPGIAALLKELQKNLKDTI